MLGCLLLIIIVVMYSIGLILFRGYLGPDGGEDPFYQHHVLLLTPAGIQALTTLYTKVIILQCPNETYCCFPLIRNDQYRWTYRKLWFRLQLWHCLMQEGGQGVKIPLLGNMGGQDYILTPPPFLETNLKVYCRFNVINNTVS